MAIRLLLADHSELALLGLRTLFAGAPRVEVVGEARDKEELYRMLSDLRPDVVLIDHVAEGFGAETLRDGRRAWHRARFVAITPAPSPVTLVNALRGGVSGYVKKDCEVEEIIDAVLATADGERFFCGKVLEAMRRASIEVDRFAGEALTCDPVTLSEREYEIIGMIAEGLSYTQIADRLHISAHTVTTHRRNLMQKLGVNNTASVVMYAVKHGLVSPNRFLFNG